MIRINNPKLLDKYILKYGISETFTCDMKPFMELVQFKKGEYICREGEPINYLFYFVEGKAKVYSTLSNGKSLLLCFYEDFKVLGDIEIFNFKSATSNVQVIEDTYCIGISVDNVRAHLLEDAKFLRYICSSLGEKLNRCSNNSSINLLYPLENRLASYIVWAGGTQFKENLTETAELLGTSYRHLLRTLNNFCEEGIIKRRDDYFEIVDDTRLRELAADLYK
jgi:CRP-like cAMP-binding protein